MSPSVAEREPMTPFLWEVIKKTLCTEVSIHGCGFFRSTYSILYVIDYLRVIVLR